MNAHISIVSHHLGSLLGAIELTVLCELMKKDILMLN